MFMLMAPETFRYVTGTPKMFTRSDLDRPVTREFCETCGTHLTTRRPDLPLVILNVIGSSSIQFEANAPS